MKIGITCYPTHGGSGVVATELGKLLADRGHQVHFISYDMPFRLGGFHQNIYYHPVEANQYSLFKYPPYDLALASRMAQVAQTYKLDLLHVHYAVPHAIAAVLAKQMVGDHLKIVTTLHGTDITVLGEDPVLKDVIKFGITQSDRVTAVSDSLAEQTVDIFQVETPIERIYNFVDQRVYYPRDVTGTCEKYTPCSHEKTLLHISNFRPVKRTEDVIRIFAQVYEKIPARLLLVGEGPDSIPIHKMVKSLGLEEKVAFLGKQDDVAQIHSLADLLLLPSEKESFGLVALEAMACGVPTIGSNAGGLPEVVEHGVTGFLSPIGDVDSMANHAVKLLTQPDLYNQFVEAGMERVQKHFSGEAVVGLYENLYHEVLEER
ncbi:N-acetyl-alpha-D-glucosaminyl L-malate synthase BshA [Thermoactinomyces sp. DSM 45891]|uniref:N-acetyl-alpha-D-glucosaminyl L-malate synthase BshA n=1 Tax=Thermoactinomyces sp. DSM 45891 TaxID=1761907 RepID=UPI0009174562|nr:N-acetyl-alpha-D-glucosaminyl L-malate synthase BshA [Thermoactinomyces sp. DSM 45891]SFW99959.1 N-acetyl-alpha-D-glucosaminyl L-malate synthase BshA [Thermoactinomyces sp. DSM 45891]